MADDKIRRDPDELELDDDLAEEEGGGVAELPANEEADEFEDEE
jgi:hypothetical protein